MSILCSIPSITEEALLWLPTHFPEAQLCIFSIQAFLDPYHLKLNYWQVLKAGRAAWCSTLSLPTPPHPLHPQASWLH